MSTGGHSHQLRPRALTRKPHRSQPHPRWSVLTRGVPKCQGRSGRGSVLPRRLRRAWEALMEPWQLHLAWKEELDVHQLWEGWGGGTGTTREATVRAGQPGDGKGGGEVQGGQTLEMRVRCHRPHVSPVTPESSSSMFPHPFTFRLASRLPLLITFLPHSLPQLRKETQP